MKWIERILTYDKLIQIFGNIFTDSDLPGYSEDDIKKWVSARFSGWYSIFPFDYTNPAAGSDLRAHIRMLWVTHKQFCAEYIKTTQYDYNPIENYSMQEESTDTTDVANSTQTSGTTQTKQATYLSSGSEYPENSSISAGTGNTNGTETKKHTFKRSGNIGVTTSQQMIEAERKLIVEPLEVLYTTFLPCFTLIPCIE